MQANNRVPRGSGENGTLQHMTTMDQPQNKTTLNQPQNTFVLNQTGEHGVMQGILGNDEIHGLHVGGSMSPGMLNDVCSGNTEVEQILDYWMRGLDHVHNIDKTDVSKEFNCEVQNNPVNQETPPVKQETTILTCTSKTGLSKHAAYFVKNHQLKCGSTKLENVQLDSLDLSKDRFDQRKEGLIGDVFHHGNDRNFKPEFLNLKELPQSIYVENLHISGTPHIESRFKKCEPRNTKGEDPFLPESVGLTQFDVWRDSLKKGDCQHASNEDDKLKISCADTKQLLDFLPSRDGSTPQVKMESGEIKCEPQNSCGEDVILSKDRGLSQDLFDASLKSDVHQHVRDKDSKRVCLQNSVLLENHIISGIPQIKVENGKIKCEPQKKEGATLSETLGHIKNERLELNTFTLKGEGENIQKSRKAFMETKIKLESCQVDINQDCMTKQGKDVKQGSTSPRLINEGVQNTFYVKHECEVNAAYLQVKKEDPVLTVNSIKREICTDGWSDSKISLDPIWASLSLQTQSQIGNTDPAYNDEKNFTENVQHCSKSKDFETDEDPIWAFQCSRIKKVKTDATSLLKSPSPSDSQTRQELRNLLVESGLRQEHKSLAVPNFSPQCQSPMITDPQEEGPGPVQQIFPSRISHKNRTVGDRFGQTTTQSSPMASQSEVVLKPAAAHQSFKCSQGAKRFNSQNTLEAETIIKHSKHIPLDYKSELTEVKKLLFCKLCGEKQISHLKEAKELNEKTVLQAKCRPNEKRFWKCCSCQDIFTTIGRFNLHQHIHLRKLSKPKIKCPVCDRVFKELRSLKTHSEVHIEGTTIPCKLCTKVFRSETKLKAHHLRCHTARTLPCDKCKAAFSTKSSLYYHKLLHRDHRPFECSECKSKFKKKHHLEIHMRIHTDERPFPCLQCSSKFRVKAHLTAHMERHLRSGSQSRPPKKPGRKRNGRKRKLSDTETSEEFSATDVEESSPSESDTSDTEGKSVQH